MCFGNPIEAAATSGERSFHLFIMTDFVFSCFSLWHPHAAVGVQMTGSFRLQVQHTRGANSDHFACMKSPVFLNRVDEPAELWLQGPVVSITDNFQMQKCKNVSIKYSCIQMSLPLTQPSMLTKDSSYFCCSGPFLDVKVVSRRAPVRRL